MPDPHGTVEDLAYHHFDNEGPDMTPAEVKDGGKHCSWYWYSHRMYHDWPVDPVDEPTYYSPEEQCPVCEMWYCICKNI